jgi:hypothetical protein
MAQKLNIDIVARDRTKQAFGALGKSLGRLKSVVFSLQSAFIGLGAGLVVRNLVNTGKELENLRVRLKFLLKDTNEGAKAFDNMVKFASKVPFSLEEIQSGSGILATVTDNAKDLQKMLEITGNVAAVTGLDFRTTAEQIQRSFSAGIGAADLFREKGVRNMLGFQAGATVSIEQTVEAFEKVFGKSGRFGKATDDLANTFTGTVSMIGDKIFSFKKTLLEEGFFEELKKQFGDLDKFLADNNEQLNNLAKTLGENLAKALRSVVDTGKNLTPFFKEVLDFVKGVKDAFMGLPDVIQKIGIIGAVLLGKKGFVGLTLILAAIDKANEFAEKFGKGIKVELEPFEHELSGNETIAARNKLIHDASIAIQKAKEKEAELNEEFLKSQQIILDIEHDMSIKLPSATQKTIDKLNELNETALENLKMKFENISMTIAEGLNAGVTRFSNALARAIVLGEDLGNAFKKMVQDALIQTLSIVIEIIMRMAIQKLLGIDLDKIEKNRLATEKNITKEKAKQVALQLALVALGGGSGGGFSFFNKGGSVTKNQPVIVGDSASGKGGELFVPNSSGQIIPNSRLGSMSGGVNVNFNINTVDASGFEELLVNSRGTISQLINQALNEKGQGNLI